MENKKNYFKNLLNSGHFFLALLLTSFAMTFIVASYEFGFLSIFIANKQVLSFVTIIFAVFAVVFIAYLCLGIKNTKITVADSLYIAFILIGLAFFIYVGIALKTFNLNRLAFAITSLVLGLFLTTVRIHNFYVNATKKVFVPKNKISKYYASVFAQFPLFAIIIISAVCVLFSYFLTDAPVISIIKQPKTLIVCAICVLPTVIYAITKITCVKITVFDALGCACILALPLILVNLVLLNYSPLKISVWAIAFAIYIIYLLLRFKFFGSKTKIQAQEQHDYFSTLFRKYDVGLILSVGGIIAMFSSLLIDSDLLHPLYDLASLRLDAHLVPIVLLTAIALISLVFFAALSLLGCKKKNVCIIDLFLQFCLSFIAFSFIALISHPSLIMPTLLIAFLIYSLVLLTIRVNRRHKN